MTEASIALNRLSQPIASQQASMKGDGGPRERGRGGEGRERGKSRKVTYQIPPIQELLWTKTDKIISRKGKEGREEEKEKEKKRKEEEKKRKEKEEKKKRKKKTRQSANTYHPVRATLSGRPCAESIRRATGLQSPVHPVNTGTWEREKGRERERGEKSGSAEESEEEKKRKTKGKYRRKIQQKIMP